MAKAILSTIGMEIRLLKDFRTWIFAREGTIEVNQEEWLISKGGPKFSHVVTCAPSDQLEAPQKKKYSQRIREIIATKIHPSTRTHTGGRA